jgi:hypothetical protein
MADAINNTMDKSPHEIHVDRLDMKLKLGKIKFEWDFNSFGNWIKVTFLGPRKGNNCTKWLLYSDAIILAAVLKSIAEAVQPEHRMTLVRLANYLGISQNIGLGLWAANAEVIHGPLLYVAKQCEEHALYKAAVYNAAVKA